MKRAIIISMLCLIFGTQSHAQWTMPTEIEEVKAPFEMPQFKRPTFPNRTMSITKCGARQGKMATTAIQKCIDRVAKRGGGTVVVPKGKWLSGRIELKSNVCLHLESGAELLFSGEIADYLPVVETRYEGVDVLSLGAMIYANHAKNIAITGNGKLIGPERDCQLMQHAMGGVSEDLQKMSLQQRVFDGTGGGEVCLPMFFSPIYCEDVFVEGVTFERSVFWNIVPVYCNRTVIRGVTVSSAGQSRTDGIDIDSSTNSLIEYTTLTCGDDCFTLKSGRGMDGIKKNRPTENVVIRNCRASGGVGAITVGSETAAMVRNVYACDCEMGKTMFGIYLKTRRPRGGGGENLWFERISFNTPSSVAFNFDMLGSAKHVGNSASRFPAPQITELTPHFRNVVFRDISVGDDCKQLIRAMGLPEAPIENVTFENIKSRCQAISMQDVGTVIFK